MEHSPLSHSKLGIINFVADRRSMLVHDWLSKKSECVIGEFPVDAMVFFCPDTLEEAKAKGFIACPHCLPYNQKRK